MMKKTRLFFFAFIIALLVAGTAPHAQPVSERPAAPEHLEYQIQRDGKSIGSYHFSKSTQDGTDQITAEMKVKVKLGFIPVYQAHHKRQEIRHNNRIISLDSRSEYNGKIYGVTFAAQDGQKSLTVNDQTVPIKNEIMTFIPWHTSTANTASLVNEKGKAHDITITDMGWKDLSIDNQSVKARHIQIRGDKSRDLWFDESDRLVYLHYKKDGHDIEFTRIPYREDTNGTL